MLNYQLYHTVTCCPWSWFYSGAVCLVLMSISFVIKKTQLCVKKWHYGRTSTIVLGQNDLLQIMFICRLPVCTYFIITYKIVCRSNAQRTFFFNDINNCDNKTWHDQLQQQFSAIISILRIQFCLDKKLSH